MAASLGAGAAPALACDVCYGASSSDSPLVSSARLGVFLLLGVTLAVLGGFVAFIVHLRNRARRFESDPLALEWAQLQRSSFP
jgi:hypothetical protein